MVMKLYHGSDVIVKKPDIRRSKYKLDFGRGFYLTSDFNQASRWSLEKARRNNKSNGYVSEFEFDLDFALKHYNVYKFASANEVWLDFVQANRKGYSIGKGVDIHIGPVADDDVYATLKLLEMGMYEKEYIIRKLKTKVLKDQWVFHNQNVLGLLSFCKAYKTMR